MCFAIKGITSFRNSLPSSFCADQKKSAIALVVALAFLIIGAFGKQERIPMGSIAAGVFSSIGSVLLSAIVLKYLNSCCYTNSVTKDHVSNKLLAKTTQELPCDCSKHPH